MNSVRFTWTVRSNLQRSRVALAGLGFLFALVAASMAEAQSASKPFIIRYTSSGALDTNYGNGGVLLPYPGTASITATGGKLMSDGRVAFGGWTDINTQPAGADFISGITTSGEPLVLHQTRFTDSGVGNSHLGRDSVVDASDRNVVGGSALLNGSRVFGLMRFMPTGFLDGSFSGDGRTLTNFLSSTNEEITSVAIAPDGKIVAAGYAVVGGVHQFATARYNVNGTLDTTYSGDGKGLTQFPGTNGSIANAVAVDATGKIVVAGFAWTGFTYTFALVRYNTNGSFDTTFDGDGMRQVDFLSSDGEVARAVIIDSSNRIIIGGFAFSFGAEQFALARLTSAGALDTSFDGDGKVLTDIQSTFSEVINDLVLAPGNRIVAIGTAQETSNTAWVAAARYNSNGSLDTSFDGDGKILTNIAGFAFDSGTAAAGIDSSGRLHIVGTVTP